MSETRDHASHHEILDQLSALLDGELEAGQAEHVRRHLETCPGCGAAWRQTRALSDSLKALPREPMPAELKRRLVARARPLPLLRRPWVLASAASAALVILLSAVVLRLEIPEPESTAREAAPAASAEKKSPAEFAPAPVLESAPRRERNEPAPPAPAAALDALEARADAEEQAVQPEAEAAPPARPAPAAAGDDVAGGILESQKQSRVTAPAPARWSTRAVEDADGNFVLDPLAPDPSDGRRPPVAGRAASSEIVLTFLARVGPGGKVSQADPVGPVPVPGDVLRKIERLLEAQDVPGAPEPGASLVIRVRLPGGR